MQAVAKAAGAPSGVHRTTLCVDRVPLTVVTSTRANPEDGTIRTVAAVVPVQVPLRVFCDVFEMPGSYEELESCRVASVDRAEASARDWVAAFIKARRASWFDAAVPAMEAAVFCALYFGTVDGASWRHACAALMVVLFSRSVCLCARRVGSRVFARPAVLSVGNCPEDSSPGSPFVVKLDKE